MKYCVVIIDGAAGLPLPQRGGKTSLEVSHIPHLDALASEGEVGLARTVPPGMEPGSACACMSVLGYDPKVYYRGRAAIEARSIGVSVGDGEAVFRCNLVAVRDGRMWDYSAGHITAAEASQLIDALNDALGSDDIEFYPGTGYRHILKLRGHQDALSAQWTPPHDIPDKPVAEHLPRGGGSDILRQLMARSEAVLREHPVNKERLARGDTPATSIWLFWGSGPAPQMPPFREVYGLSAALTSGVGLLKGLGRMMAIDILEIPGVTDGPDNDYAAQADGALEALRSHDVVVVHIESPDEASHAGSIEEKVDAIQRIDSEVIGRLRSVEGLRLLAMPDHHTPIELRTHTLEPVPFILWGPGLAANGAKGFTEAEAEATGLLIDPGYNIMGRLAGK